MGKNTSVPAQLESMRTTSRGLLETIVPFYDTIKILSSGYQNPNINMDYVNNLVNSINLDFRRLVAELNMLDEKLVNLKKHVIDPNVYMSYIVLGEEYRQWQDQYTGLVIVPCSDVTQHINIAINMGART